ncbi:MAG: DUF6359 domain-containing protein [Prevotella sp.]
MSKNVFPFIILSLFLVIAGCQKVEVEVEQEEEQETNNDETSTTGWHDTITVDNDAFTFVNVEAAIQAPLGSMLVVRGYVLGSTSRNIYNTIAGPPFESRSSLVLADTIFRSGDNPGEYDGFTEDDLLPVCLTDYKDVQNALNLVDHPEHWHRLIYIWGIKSTYLNMPGIRNIMYYEFE